MQAIMFGRYLLSDRLSVGGMAEVFRAKTSGTGGFEKLIAIKRILPSLSSDKEFVKMFIDEAKIAGQLSHPNIGKIYELGRSDGAYFIAMEYIAGKDLLQVSRRLSEVGQSMPINVACYVVASICLGLDYAHKKKDRQGRSLGIIHRDCSPQNILLSYAGHVKLIDFGIAKAVSRLSRTVHGVLKGKFAYMSPEQVRSMPVDHRSDIFSLGAVLYEALIGKKLFQADSDFATLENVRNVTMVPAREIRNDVPEEVEQIIGRALAREVEDRYSSCQQMAGDLTAYLAKQKHPFGELELSDWVCGLFPLEFAKEQEGSARALDAVVPPEDPTEVKQPVDHVIFIANMASVQTADGQDTIDEDGTNDLAMSEGQQATCDTLAQQKGALAEHSESLAAGAESTEKASGSSVVPTGTSEQSTAAGKSAIRTTASKRTPESVAEEFVVGAKTVVDTEMEQYATLSKDRSVESNASSLAQPVTTPVSGSSRVAPAAGSLPLSVRHEDEAFADSSEGALSIRDTMAMDMSEQLQQAVEQENNKQRTKEQGALPQDRRGSAVNASGDSSLNVSVEPTGGTASGIDEAPSDHLSEDMLPTTPHVVEVAKGPNSKIPLFRARQPVGVSTWHDIAFGIGIAFVLLGFASILRWLLG